MKSLVVMLAACIATAGAIAKPQSPQEIDAASAHLIASDEADKVECSPFVYQSLPGVFNYCLARKYWAQGRFERAEQVLKLAAAWGNKSAQVALGVSYFNGVGLAKDRPLGLAWLRLAAERGDAEYVGIYNAAFDDSSVVERSEGAVQLARLIPDYADKKAAVRADEHYNRSVRNLASNPVYGSGKCIAGVSGIPGQVFGDFRRNLENPTELNSSVGCSMMSELQVVHALQDQYASYFEGWEDGRQGGRVKIGNLQGL